MISNLLQITGKKKGLLNDPLEDIYNKFIGISTTGFDIKRSDDYGEFIVKMPASSYVSQIATYSMLLGAIGALFYISYRVWKQLANNEPIAIFPLLRPFFIGLCIMNFHTIVIFINGIFHKLVLISEELKPENVDPTYKLKDGVEAYRKKTGWQKFGEGFVYGFTFSAIGSREELQKDYVITTAGRHRNNMLASADGYKKGHLVTIPDCSMGKSLYTIGADVECAGKKILKFIVDGIIKLIIMFLNLYRLIGLSILYILFPLALGLSIFDGFQSSITSWLTRYVNMYLWLPVANIIHGFLSIVSVILLINDSSFWTMLLYGIMCIFVFTKVPNITSWIVNPGIEDGGGAMGGAAAGALGGLIGGAKGAATRVGGGAGSLLGAGVKKIGAKLMEAASKKK